MKDKPFSPKKKELIVNIVTFFNEIIGVI